MVLLMQIWHQAVHKSLPQVQEESFFVFICSEPSASCVPSASCMGKKHGNPKLHFSAILNDFSCCVPSFQNLNFLSLWKHPQKNLHSCNKLSSGASHLHLQRGYPGHLDLPITTHQVFPVLRDNLQKALTWREVCAEEMLVLGCTLHVSIKNKRERKNLYRENLYREASVCQWCLISPPTQYCGSLILWFYGIGWAESARNWISPIANNLSDTRRRSAW